MQTIGILILIFCACLIAFSVQGCRNSKPATGSSSDPVVTVQQVDSLSRAQIEQMLQQLQKQKAPKPTMGAMCYDMAGPPPTADYVCPACGQKTVYSKDTSFVTWELGSCRREFEQMTKTDNLKMVLDESSFCSNCSPNADKHELVLKITYSDGTTHSAGGIHQSDLRMLTYFFKGSLSFKGLQDGTEPLKDHLPRLRELLGLEASAAKGQP
ncbi:MAG: hypothetical protein GX455_07680 [Phycisphaerae bacterium]|nr:hypothetical protein [Phycisphaerae bacterium]